MYARTIPVQTKVHLKKNAISGYDVYNGGFKFCFRAVIFSLFKHFPEAEMTWSQLIIVRECIFKNQNLCFASR